MEISKEQFTIITEIAKLLLQGKPSDHLKEISRDILKAKEIEYIISHVKSSFAWISHDNADIKSLVVSLVNSFTPEQKIGLSIELGGTPSISKDNEISKSYRGGKSVSGHSSISCSLQEGKSISESKSISASLFNGESTVDSGGIAVVIFGGVAKSENMSISITGGWSGTSISGNGSISVSRNNGTAISGKCGTSLSEIKGTSEAGVEGVAITGNDGIAQAGEGGVLCWIYPYGFMGKTRVHVENVGENGIKPNTKYNGWFNGQTGKFIVQEVVENKELTQED